LKNPRLIASLGVAGLVAGGLGGAALTRAVHAQKESKPAAAALPDLQPNSDWQPINVATEKRVEARAWSDAAAGCHLALFALSIPNSSASDKIFESLNATMATSDYQLTKSEVEMNPPRLDLEGFGVTGIATLTVAEGQDREAHLLACYWNGREASYCRALCEAADDKMRAMLSKNESEKQP
jgi:hypothetical protein